jgi:hypothetical protein
MQKIDFKKELKQFYTASAKKIVQVDVPALPYLMVDGQGDPNTAPAFAAAVEALFAVAYTLKFMVKKGALAMDYGVMPLEGLWWVEDMANFSCADKSDWQWTAMILQPPFITADMVAQAIAAVRQKKSPVALDKLRFDTYTAGCCAQTLHIGPFSEEGPTIAKVHAFIAELGGERVGKHHEIYLSDVRRAAPDKWKTIIRQGIRPLGRC